MASFSDLVFLMVDDILNQVAPVREVVDTFMPALEECVSTDKFTNETALSIMDKYPDEGSLLEKVDYFAGLKERKQRLESEQKALSDSIRIIQEELIQWIEANPVSDLVSSNGKKLSTMSRTYAKVTDISLFKRAVGPAIWAQLEGVKQKELNDLVKTLKQQAESLGEDLSGLLPEGCEVSIKKSLTMRNVSKKASKTNLDAIMDLINQPEDVPFE